MKTWFWPSFTKSYHKIITLVAEFWSITEWLEFIIKICRFKDSVSISSWNVATCIANSMWTKNGPHRICESQLWKFWSGIICFKETVSLQIFQRLPSKNFTWPILDHVVLFRSRSSIPLSKEILTISTSEFSFLWTCNHSHNILRLFDVLPNFPFTTGEAMRDYYL